MQGTIRFPQRLGILAFLLVAALASAAQAFSPMRVDHHTHLNSPAIMAFVPDFCASIKRQHFDDCDAALTTPHAPQELLAQMDKAHIARAIVLSSAYLAQSPLMQPPRQDATALMRAANAWTVDLARKHPRRFAAFISVDPLHVDDALAEMAHWRGNPNVAGLKLHLTTSSADLSRDSDLADLARVFAAAHDAHWPIVIHLRTMQMNYGADDARRFLEKVLPAAGDTPVQIAHAAGWGGIDAPTLAALGVFADAMAADRERYRHLLFDLSGVATDKASDADKQAMAALIRKIGVDHFLPGSDWPYNGVDLAGYYATTFSNLPLTQAEWAVIRGNVVPYMR